MPKNTQAKTRKPNEPYEVWTSRPDVWNAYLPEALISTVEKAKAVAVTGGWTWLVLKKWQADDNKPYARWMCKVYTPIVPEGEMGDVYVHEIKSDAVQVYAENV